MPIFLGTSIISSGDRPKFGKILMSNWFIKSKRVLSLVWFCKGYTGFHLFFTLLLSLFQVRLSIVLDSQFNKLKSIGHFSLFRMASNKSLRISDPVAIKYENGLRIRMKGSRDEVFVSNR